MFSWLQQGRDVPVDTENVEEMYGLDTITTTQFVPTELNSYMYRYEGHLARMAEALGKEEAAAYEEAAAERKHAMNSLMWDSSTAR